MLTTTVADAPRLVDQPLGALRDSDSRSAPPRRTRPSTPSSTAVALDAGQETRASPARDAGRRTPRSSRAPPAPSPSAEQRAEHVGVGMDVAEHERAPGSRPNGSSTAADGRGLACRRRPLTARRRLRPVLSSAWMRAACSIERSGRKSSSGVTRRSRCWRSQLRMKPRALARAGQRGRPLRARPRAPRRRPWPSRRSFDGLDLGHRHEAEARVLELALQERRDLLLDELVDAVQPLALHQRISTDVSMHAPVHVVLDEVHRLGDDLVGVPRVGGDVGDRERGALPDVLVVDLGHRAPRSARAPSP